MTENSQLSHHEVHLEKSFYPISIVAADISIASNIGSIFRICDALGVEKLYLTGDSVQPPSTKLLKAARSTEKSVPFEYNPSARNVVDQLRSDDYDILSLEISAKSIDLRDYKNLNQRKICLVLGSEANGIDDEILNISDHTIHIPMHGQNSSMNVASAASIATFYLCNLLAK